MNYSKTIENLIDSFARLPGIGRKTAERLAFQLLDMPDEYIKEFAQNLDKLKTNIHFCKHCGLICSTGDECDICKDPDRDHKTILVISSVKDAYAFEKIRYFRGIYFVLKKLLSPAKGVGVDDLHFEDLEKLINENKATEVIIATDTTLEGETTALYLSKLLNEKGINVSRLAFGLPIGSKLDYADSLTLTKALEGRKKI